MKLNGLSNFNETFQLQTFQLPFPTTRIPSKDSVQLSVSCCDLLFLPIVSVQWFMVGPHPWRKKISTRSPNPTNYALNHCGLSTFVDRSLSTMKTIQFLPLWYNLYPTDFVLRTIHFVISGPSTFTDRSLLVTLGPVQTPWTVYLGPDLGSIKTIKINKSNEIHLTRIL